MKATNQKNINSKTVVFITGAFVTHNGWNEWKRYFEAQGYTTYNPSWPGKEGEVAELRAKHPANNTKLATLTLREVVDHYAAFVQSLPEKPILIGHSMGGLITQILINRGLGSAGVGIYPFPPLGVVLFEFSFLKSAWKALGLFTSLKKTYMMSFKDWQYAFVNGMSLADQQKAYNENTIPESKTVARGALTPVAKIDFSRTHAPLLITSGDKDNILPHTLNYRNFKRYKQNNGSITDYKEFKNRNHFVLGQDTWKEDADYILNWLKN